MSLRVLFRRAARAEFDEAVDWYEKRRTGLGDRFAVAVDAILDGIVAQPDFYPIVMEDIREALIPGFPYCVYYRVGPRAIRVLSVFHTARDPSIWQSRS